MNRRGFSVVETVVTLLVAALILGAAMALYYSSNTMARTSDLAGGLQEAALAMEIIQTDLVQAVRKPDPGVDRVVRLTAKSAQLIRGKIALDGSVTGVLVVYRFEKSPTGSFRIRRGIGAERQLLPGEYESIAFDELDGAGGPFVRVSLAVLTHGKPIAEGKASDRAVLTALVRTGGPDLLASSSFEWKDLEAVKQVQFETGAEY